MSFEVREDMHLEVHDIGIHFLTVQDLEWTEEICTHFVPVRECQQPVVRLEQEAFSDDTTGSVRLS